MLLHILGCALIASALAYSESDDLLPELPKSCVTNLQLKVGKMLYKCVDGEFTEFVGCLGQDGLVIKSGHSYAPHLKTFPSVDLAYGFLERCEESGFVRTACVFNYPAKADVRGLEFVKEGESTQMEDDTVATCTRNEDGILTAGYSAPKPPSSAVCTDDYIYPEGGVYKQCVKGEKPFEIGCDFHGEFLREVAIKRVRNLDGSDALYRCIKKKIVPLGCVLFDHTFLKLDDVKYYRDAVVRCKFVRGEMIAVQTPYF